MPLETLNIHDKASREEFKPTAEELRVIGEKMRDPEFAKLMNEYMQSLSDPETRKEEEEYLKQMEREAKEGGDYSFDFIFPKPGFVVQLTQTPGYKKGQGVYVNVCESDRVDEFREETTGDRWGSNWHVPVAVSQERTEEYQDSEVVVFDAVFHPKTRALADRSDRFLCFLVEIAVEHINAGYKKAFGFEFKRLPTSVASIGTPKNQTVKKEKGKSAFPFSTEPVSKRPVKPDPPAAATAPAPSASKSKGGTATASPSTVPAVPSAGAPQTQVPKFSVMHRGEVDLLDAWQWKVVDKRVGIPKELVVKVEFPGVTSAAHLDLDVVGEYIEVSPHAQHKFGGCIPLPFTVDRTPVSAKFDKSKQVLTLTLRVVPPQLPKDAITAQDVIREQQRRVTESTEPSASTDDLEPSASQRSDAPEAPAAVQQPLAPPVAVDPTSSEAPAVNEERQTEPTSAASPSSMASPVKQVQRETSSEPDAPSSPLKAADDHATEVQPQIAHLNEDRASQLMAKLQQARQEREEAERAANAAAAAAQPSASASADVPTVAKGVDEEAAPEVIDLRKKQSEWLDSVKRQQQEQELQRQREEEEQQHAASEALRRQQKEAKRKLEAEKEQERLEAEYQRKLQELPLRSRFIFDIE